MSRTKQRFSLCVIVFLVVLAQFVFAGCSGSPSVSDVRKIVERQIEEQSNGLIRLITVEKTNSQEGEMMGIKFLILEYRAEIEFAEDAWWGKPFRAEPQAAATGYWGGFNMQLKGMKQVSKGERLELTGKIQFEKTEEGWRANE